MSVLLLDADPATVVVEDPDGFSVLVSDEPATSVLVLDEPENVDVLESSSEPTSVLVAEQVRTTVWIGDDTSSEVVLEGVEVPTVLVVDDEQRELLIVDPAGPRGPVGPQGAPGLGEIFTYVMPVAQTTAVIDHNLGRDPIAVQVLDEAGVPGDEYDVVFTQPGAQVRVSFDLPFAATIRLT